MRTPAMRQCDKASLSTNVLLLARAEFIMLYTKARNGDLLLVVFAE